MRSLWLLCRAWLFVLYATALLPVFIFIGIYEGLAEYVKVSARGARNILEDRR